MDERRTMDGQAAGLMLLLCLTWSGQQILLKATAEDFSPVLQISLRSGIAALLVGALLLWRGERLPLGGSLGRAGWAAGTLFALEYLLVGEGLRFTSAAHMAVFLYTAPIFAALGLHWRLPAERLAPLQWLGIALAFAGIAISFLLRDTGAQQDWRRVLWGDALGVLAGMAWGATTVLVRTTGLARLPAVQTLLYQLLGGCLWLLPAALLTGQTVFRPGPLVWSSLVFQSVVVCCASFLLWFWLLRRYLAAPLGVFSFLTPVLGVVLGAWLLHEPMEPSFVGGALLVLVGVVLVSAQPWLAARWGRRAAQA